jgi:hypothetical protein
LGLEWGGVWLEGGTIAPSRGSLAAMEGLPETFQVEFEAPAPSQERLSRLGAGARCRPFGESKNKTILQTPSIDDFRVRGEL